MYTLNRGRLFRLLAALLCICMLLSSAAGAEEILAPAAVEDVPVIGGTSAETAPATAELIDASAQAETQAKAPEIKRASGHADGVLQAGGFPKAYKVPRAELCADYTAAETAIYNGLLGRAEEIMLYDFEIPLADLSALYQRVINDHPEMFYVESDYSYSYIGSTAYALYPFYSATGPDDEMLFQTACSDVVAQLDPGWGDLQKVLFLHDWLVTHVEYDDSLTHYSAFDAMVGRSAVCQGYALAFRYLGMQAGLNILYVTSVDIAHAWNAVWLDGEFFYIDCTWDDPSNGWYEGYCAHNNFLRSRDGMVSTNHTSSDWLCNGEPCYADDLSSTRYEDPTDAWWTDVTTAIAQIGSTCAYGTNDSEYDVILRDFWSGSKQFVPLVEPAIWPVFNDPGYYYNNLFYSFTTWNGAFYFTTAEAVFRLDLYGGTPEQIYTISEGERATGYLYGIVNDGGRLYYNIGTGPCLGSAPRTEEYTRVELVLEGHVHNLVYDPGQEPSCTEPGWAPYEYCPDCGYTTYSELPPLEHDYVQETVEFATCTEPGVFRYLCTRCGYSYDLTIPALGHDLMHHDGMEPSCTEPGWEEYDTCFRCDYTTYTELPAIGHLPDHIAYNAPTAEEEGNLECWYCPGCGKYYLDEDCMTETTWEDVRIPTIPDHVHNFIYYPAKAPTCTEPGWDAYEVCFDCGYTTYVELPPVGHTFDYFPYKDATPWEDGNNEYWYCTVCESYFLDPAGSEPTTWDAIVIPKLTEHVHDFVHYDGQAPSCTDPGWAPYDTCTGCGYTTYTELPPTGHVPSHVPYKEATAEEDGNFEYWYCPACGRYFLDEDCGSETTATALVIPKSGEHVHSFTTYAGQAPTCTESGWDPYEVCSVCGYSTYSELPATGHTFSYYPATEATTLTDGNIEYWYCSNCGKYFLDPDGNAETTADAVILPRLDNPDPPVLTTPTFTVATVTARSGSVADVKIDLADNPGIAGAMLRLNYDPTLVLKNITVGDALTGLTFTRPGALSDNPINLVWDGLDADATNGTVLTLTFEVPATAADGSYAVMLSCEPDDVYTGSMTDVMPVFVDGGITVQNVLRGDVNGDNKVNAKDVTMMRRALAGGYGLTTNTATADVNGDNKVNAKDVTTLRRYLAGGYGITLG